MVTLFDVLGREREERRLFSRLVPNGECWEWTGASNARGYGVLSVRGRQHYTHRLAYLFACGEIPDDMIVCHDCDNPRCCRPEHLFLGTHQDNSDDKYTKGRGNSPRGSQRPEAKLTEDDVREIRHIHAAGEMGYRRLAAKYGVNQRTIMYAIQRRTWGHVE